ncbi:MAG TPA: prolyl oligopeptidase family serine peptidase [Gemmata sp.]|jgi:dienelactone hydrolase|nr:prolyl oligopeptidase family serine peptidase [Gemmata sp.]
MTHRTCGLSSLVALFFAAPMLSAADPSTAAVPAPASGTVRFDPKDDEKAGVVERYRMPEFAFDYKLTLRHDLRHTGVRVFDLSFPSPIKSEVPENNTVYAELFLPPGEGPFPAAIVLDILQGNALVSRGEAMWLAQHGVAGLVVYMAHYGPRRPPGSSVRLLSMNISHTLDAVKQTVLDVRCAVAWLAGRREIDANNLGIVGTSLGSFLSAIVAANEPRIKNVCLMLTGGGLVDAYYDHPLAKPYTPLIDLVGGKVAMKMLIAPVDPLTYAKQLKGKNLLMICASRDDVVPPKAATRLWEATGKQKIVWVDSTHVGAGLYALPVLQAMSDHIRGDK